MNHYRVTFELDIIAPNEEASFLQAQALYAYLKAFQPALQEVFFGKWELIEPLSHKEGEWRA